VSDQNLEKTFRRAAISLVVRGAICGILRAATILWLAMDGKRSCMDCSLDCPVLSAMSNHPNHSETQLLFLALLMPLDQHQPPEE
jgi:hypothetical protein